ncbi:MAG TPA: hypothetical protein VNG69_03960 [Casimicrobiaceae bacterium]|nr:hypothetical protein [Casimicrobiaceae bacterium]
MNGLESRFGAAALLWFLAFAAVAAIIGWETDWGRTLRRAPEPPAPAAAQRVDVSLLPDYQVEGGAAARRETVDRPAFVPTRRPAPPPAAQEVAKPKMQRGQFALTGTAVVDKNSIAFLREMAGGKARSVRAGDTINGITIAEVGADRVKLVMGDESEELVLKVASGPRTTIQPPIQPQPGAPGVTPGVVPVAGQAPGGAQQPPRAPAPGVAGAPQTPAVAGAQFPVPGSPESDAALLERRRAARAAQAAAETAARAEAQARVNAAGSNTTPDPAWAEVYRRMQQPRK